MSDQPRIRYRLWKSTSLKVSTSLKCFLYLTRLFICFSSYFLFMIYDLWLLRKKSSLVGNEFGLFKPYSLKKRISSRINFLLGLHSFSYINDVPLLTLLIWKNATEVIFARCFSLLSAFDWIITLLQTFDRSPLRSALRAFLCYSSQLLFLYSPCHKRASIPFSDLRHSFCGFAVHFCM